MAQSKLKQIERMGEIEKPESANTKVFSIKTKPRVESGNDVMFAESIEIGYDKPLTKISFKIKRRSNIFTFDITAYSIMLYLLFVIIIIIIRIRRTFI